MHLSVLLILLCGVTTAALRTCDVTEFGAKGDNVTEDTAALQAALDACTPGETILPAPGKYLSRSLNFTGKSNIAVRIEAGATLVLWPDVATWNASGTFADLLSNAPFHRARADTTGTDTRSSSSSSSTSSSWVSNVTITGGGTIDGQGWRWWPLFPQQRPRLVSFEAVTGFELSNLTLLDSPSWNTNLRGSHIRVTNVTVLTNAGSCDGFKAAPTTDGFNVGGDNIYIADCYVHNGDDCIPVFAYNGTDTFNVLVERVQCHCGTNGGVAILGDDYCGGQNANIYNVTFRDMVVNGTNQGAGVKICEPFATPHGTVSNVTWSNVTISNPRNVPLYTNVFTEDGCNTPANASARVNWLSTAGLTFSSVRAQVLPGTPAGCFMCTAERPCTGMVFDDVVVTAVGSGGTPAPYVCMNADVGSAVGSSPQPCGGR
jgi:polygalacturonase